MPKFSSSAVPLRILLTALGAHFYYTIKSEVGHYKKETSARRALLDSSKEGQSNKKCSVSTMPSLDGHIGFMVSLKLCLNLWKFNLLRPTLSCVR